MSLKDQIIVILGGSSGIGLATARAAIGEGARVVITGRTRATLDAAAAQLGKEARAAAVDSSDEAAMRELFAGIDHVDHIFANAGNVVGDAKLKMDIAAIRPAIDVRFWGAVYAAKFGAPKMHAGGSIVLMSGTAAVRPISGSAVGSAACAAVEGLARSLAIDLAPIRVNAIRPGLIDTPLIDRFVGERKESFLKSYAARLPVKRIGRPEEVADAVLFLMKNGFVTGITLPIDGGGAIS